MLNRHISKPINEDINEDKRYISSNYNMSSVIKNLKYISKDLEEIKKGLIELHTTNIS